MNDVIGGDSAKSHANDVDVPVCGAGEPMFLVNDLFKGFWRTYAVVGLAGVPLALAVGGYSLFLTVPLLAVVAMVMIAQSRNQCAPESAWWTRDGIVLQADPLRSALAAVRLLDIDDRKRADALMDVYLKLKDGGDLSDQPTIPAPRFNRFASAWCIRAVMRRASVLGVYPHGLTGSTWRQAWALSALTIKRANDGTLIAPCMWEDADGRLLGSGVDGTVA
jgi:hypothetical protein